MSNQDSHELIQMVKDLALELGRTPRRSEFERLPNSRNRMERVFGGYTALIQAAGLEPNKVTARKIDNSIFERDIERHLEAYQPVPPPKLEPYPSIIVISDIHWPFENQRVIDACLSRIEKVKPECVIINGDAADMYSHAKFPRSHNLFTPREEQRLFRERNEEFWREVQKRSPKSKCTQTLGNHDIRALKRVLEVYPAAEDWIERAIHDLFTFDGVKTIYDPREEVLLPGNIAVFHGYRSQLGAHRDYTLMNCINGHSHVGGVVYRQIRGQVLWEANSGLAGDPEAKGLTYTPQRMTKWTPGFLEVDSLGARFISV